MSKFRILFLISWYFLSSFSAASEEKRFAFLVATEEYPNLGVVGKLNTPINDVSAFKAILDNLGYQVTFLKNPSITDLEDTWYKFLESIPDNKGLPNKERENVKVVVYLSGHGAVVNKSNYYLANNSVGPNPRQIDRFTRRAIKTDSIIDSLNQLEPTSAILVIDACRDEPFIPGTTRTLSGRLGAVSKNLPENTSNMVVLYSADQGRYAYDRALDEDNPSHSIFARHFINAARDSSKDIGEIASIVGKLVQQQTIDKKLFPQGQQKPRLNLAPGTTPICLGRCKSSIKPNIMEKTINLSVDTGYAPNFPILGSGLKRVSRRAFELSGGKVNLIQASSLPSTSSELSNIESANAVFRSGQLDEPVDPYGTLSSLLFDWPFGRPTEIALYWTNDQQREFLNTIGRRGFSVEIAEKLRISPNLLIPCGYQGVLSIFYAGSEPSDLTDVKYNYARSLYSFPFKADQIPGLIFRELISNSPMKWGEFIQMKDQASFIKKNPDAFIHFVFPWDLNTHASNLNELLGKLSPLSNYFYFDDKIINGFLIYMIVEEKDWHKFSEKQRKIVETVCREETINAASLFEQERALFKESQGPDIEIKIFEVEWYRDLYEGWLDAKENFPRSLEEKVDNDIARIRDTIPHSFER